MTVGNLEDAKQALAGNLKRVGEGASRTGFLSPDGGVVYKVEHRRYGMNQVEYDTMTELRELGFPYIQDTTLWDVDGVSVLAIPYIEKDCLDVPKVAAKFWDEVTHFFSDSTTKDSLLWDTGSSNLRVKGNRAYITDLQWIDDYDNLERY